MLGAACTAWPTPGSAGENFINWVSKCIQQLFELTFSLINYQIKYLIRGAIELYFIIITTSFSRESAVRHNTPESLSPLALDNSFLIVSSISRLMPGPSPTPRPSRSPRTSAPASPAPAWTSRGSCGTRRTQVLVSLIRQSGLAQPAHKMVQTAIHSVLKYSQSSQESLQQHRSQYQCVFFLKIVFIMCPIFCLS